MKTWDGGKLPPSSHKELRELLEAAAPKDEAQVAKNVIDLFLKALINRLPSEAMGILSLYTQLRSDLEKMPLSFFQSLLVEAKHEEVKDYLRQYED